MDTSLEAQNVFQRMVLELRSRSVLLTEHIKQHVAPAPSHINAGVDHLSSEGADLFQYQKLNFQHWNWGSEVSVMVQVLLTICNRPAAFF